MCSLDFILTMARPSRGQDQCKLRDAIKATFGGKVDTYGNLWVDMGGMTVFTAHLDTVHRKGGFNPVSYLTGKKTGFRRAIAAGGECLGADDGAGVYLLCEMMRADCPGMYLFTLDEEVGCIGASHAADDSRLLAYNRAVAFDRKGKTDICVTQRSRKLCSDEFCDALAAALNMGHKRADGIYTDNSEFGDVIPEIVNISVGYENAHGPTEYLDLDYLHGLRSKVIAIDWDSLPTVRVPSPEIWGKSSGWESTGWDDETIAYDVADDAMISICDILGIDKRGLDYDAIHAAIVEAHNNWHGSVSSLGRSYYGR